MNTRSHGLPITSEGPASRTRSSVTAEARNSPASEVRIENAQRLPRRQRATGSVDSSENSNTTSAPRKRRRTANATPHQNLEPSRQQSVEVSNSIPEHESPPVVQANVQTDPLLDPELPPRRFRRAGIMDSLHSSRGVHIPARRHRVSIMSSLRTSPGPDVQANEVEELSRSLLDPAIGAAAVLRFEDSGRVAQPGQGRRGEQGVISSGRVIPSTGSALVRNPRGPGSPGTSQSGVKKSLKRKGETEVDCKNSVASVRLLQEIQTIDEKIPPGCHAAPKADDLHEWAAVIEGPTDTVYAGGTFFCNITLPLDYPFHPPKVSFQTRIYHCNINAQGEVCLDVLRDKWDPTMDISMVLQSLLTLMYDCNPDDALVCPIGKQFKEDREQFDKTARMWTQRYAS